jgi:hypothetical protein
VREGGGIWAARQWSSEARQSSARMHRPQRAREARGLVGAAWKGGPRQKAPLELTTVQAGSLCADPDDPLLLFPWFLLLIARGAWPWRW